MPSVAFAETAMLRVPRANTPEDIITAHRKTVVLYFMSSHDYRQAMSWGGENERIVSFDYGIADINLADVDL
jgi:hypothetical protein